MVTRALFGKKPASSPPSTNVSVPLTELTETCRRAIKTYGYDDDETAVLLDVMMYAQLRGNNQGIIKVTTKGIARDPAASPIHVEHETQLSACLNGNKNAGMVVIHKAMDMAIDKAKTHGFGICGTNNTSTSTGALGYYAQKIAEEGLIALVFAVSPEFVAPNGAIEPIFGTNPVGVGDSHRGQAGGAGHGHQRLLLLRAPRGEDRGEEDPTRRRHRLHRRGHGRSQRGDRRRRHRGLRRRVQIIEPRARRRAPRGASRRRRGHGQDGV